MTITLINQCDALPRAGYFARRFGNLISVYQRVGFKARFRYGWAALTRRLFAATCGLGELLAQQSGAAGAQARWQRQQRMLYLNGELRVYLLFVRCSVSNFGSARWVIRLRPKQKPDLTVLVRMKPRNEGVQDFYLLPSLDLNWRDNQFAENNGIYFDAFRFASLDFLIGLAARVQLPQNL